MDHFTDEELRAYIGEELAVSRSTALEGQLPSDPLLQRRLQQFLDEDATGLAVGSVWRRYQLSCPSRSTWADFLAGRLGDGLRQYLEFHRDVVGCRLCAANVADLETVSDDAAERRARRYFETSVGRLKNVPDVQ